MSSYDLASRSERLLRRIFHAPGRSAARYWSIIPLILLFFSFTGPLRSAAIAETSTPAVPRASIPGSSVILKGSSYTFPVTPVGQSSTSCRALCFCTDSSRCNCNASGTQTLTHSLAPPFHASGYLVQPYANGTFDCRSGTPAQLPVVLKAGQQMAFTISFSPTRPGTFSDYLGITSYILNLSGSTPRGSASLVPYQPAGWSAPVVVSRTRGVRTDSSALTGADPLYVSWAIQNAGDLSTFDSFYIDLYLDGIFKQRWIQRNSVEPHSYIYVADFSIGTLSAGTHTLKVVPDITHVIGQSNTFSKNITVALPGPPPKPPTSTSWYVEAVGRNKEEAALQRWAFRVGQQAGQMQESSGSSQLVILFFGQPWKMAKGAYGATGYGPGLTVSQISNVAKQYLMGHQSATHYGLLLALGTSNNGPYVTVPHAQAWANMLIDLDAWTRRQGFSSVRVASANDSELSFTAGPSATKAWYRALSDEIARSGRQIVSFDFGDAQACPLSSAASSVSRACGTTGWTHKDIADLLALYIPQIYNNSTALEWEQISLYIDLRSRTTGTLIRAPLSQYQACTPARLGCQYTSNTPVQAWRQLVRALRSDATTAPGTQQLMWSTDIEHSTDNN